jgi:hypothetical protein
MQNKTKQAISKLRMKKNKIKEDLKNKPAKKKKNKKEIKKLLKKKMLLQKKKEIRELA